MKERKSYVGTLNGVSGVWCDQKPEGLEVIKENTFYSADEGKVFVDKEGNMLDSVILKEGETIDEYNEIVKPKEETNEQTEM